MPFSRLRFFISFASFLFNGCKFTHFPRNTQTIRNFFSLYPFRLLFLSSFSLFAFQFPLYFRTFAIKDGELTPSRQKKKPVSLFCARFFVTLQPIIDYYIIINMKKLYLLSFVACLATSSLAQDAETFELGKPGDNNYRYLDDYKALKEYVDRTQYPNFKLGAGTTVGEYLKKSTVYNLTNKNFNETVAGNAMKMGSCVDYNSGNMNFNTVKQYVNAATEAGLNVYGHTLAWHSQQPKGWLLSLMADKPDPTSEEVFQVIANKDLRSDQTVGFKSDETENGYTITFDTTNGLKVKTTKSLPWQVQFVIMQNIPLTAGKTFKMTFTVKGSKAGMLDGHIGDWTTNNDNDNSTGTSASIPFSTEWQDAKVDIVPTVDNNFILLHVPNYVGNVYIKNIKVEGYKQNTIPQTMEEKHDALVGAMDKWIKGMMEACEGKAMAWDLVNEAIAGDGDDGEGNYTLQHSDGYKSGTWDVGGDAFYWQDYMGDLDYVRQACRLARQYGPEGVKLFINDYNLEGTWDLKTQDGITASKKLWSLVNWIKKWESDDVTHIDGIGTQMHISCYENTNTLNNLKKAITGMFTLMASTGKYVRVSEMDMGYVSGSWPNEKDLNTAELNEDQHKAMADFYEWIIKEYLRIVPAEQQWGICQWCPTDAPAQGWRANKPVGIWDLNYYRKHAYAGFVRGLSTGGTAINSVKTDSSTKASKGIFTLSGQRLPVAHLDQLPSGLYIVNGKKIVTK